MEQWPSHPSAVLAELALPALTMDASVPCADVEPYGYGMFGRPLPADQVTLRQARSPASSSAGA